MLTFLIKSKVQTTGDTPAETIDSVLLFNGNKGRTTEKKKHDCCAVEDLHNTGFIKTTWTTFLVCIQARVVKEFLFFNNQYIICSDKRRRIKPVSVAGAGL